MSEINEKEITAAKNAANDNSPVYTHIFKVPFVREDKTYEKLTFDFAGLTGADCLAIEDEMRMLGKPLIAPEFSGEFLCRMSARAAGVGADVLMALPMADYNKIRSKARSFLLASGL